MLRFLAVIVIGLAVVTHAQVVGNGEPQHDSSRDESAHPPTCFGCIQIQPTSPEQQKKSQHQPYQWSEFKSPANVINLLLAAAAFWAGGMALRTLRAIKEQTKEAARSAKAAEDAATAALKQANHIETTERAWVIPAPQRPNPPIPEITDKNAMAPLLVAVNILFENKGHTPAFIKNIATGGCAISRNDTPDLSDTKEWRNVGAIPIVPRHSFVWEHERIEIEQAIQIRSGKLNLWLYGIIGYSDIFGKERTTGFCFRLEPSNMEWLLSGPTDANWAD